MRFNEEEFWVQMYNLSLACMTRDIGTQIGKTIGTVKDVDVREDGIGWENLLEFV